MKKLKKIFVEITNCCNLSCRFCHQSQRSPAFITPEAFRATLLQLDGWTDHLALHLLGEPLLHPQLTELLTICHQQRLQVNLTTNATLLAANRITLLKSPALRQINLSLHSLTAKPGEIPSSLDEILDFIDEGRRTTPLFFSLRLWNLTQERGDEVNQSVRHRLQTFFKLPAPLPASLTPGQGIRLAPQVFLSQDVEFTWPHSPAPDLGMRGTCRALSDHIGILVDGTVVPCCLDAEGDIPLGNIYQATLEEILASPRAHAMRQGFAARRLLEPLCRRCSYRQRFDV